MIRPTITAVVTEWSKVTRMLGATAVSAACNAGTTLSSCSLVAYRGVGVRVIVEKAGCADNAP